MKKKNLHDTDRDITGQTDSLYFIRLHKWVRSVKITESL